MRRSSLAAALLALAASFAVRAMLPGAAGVVRAQQTVSPATWSVTVVLPPRLVAGGPATLATLGVNGKLAPNMTVTLGDNGSVRTDVTGRAFFTAPASGGVLLAHAAGSSAAALIDPPDSATAQKQMTVPPAVSLRDRFSICGGGFRGDAEADHVRVDGATALILASSPECLVVIAEPKTPPGGAKIFVETPSAQREGAATVVALTFEPPQPALTPGKKGWLTVRARGSSQPLRILVTNETPGVLRFEKGEWQQVTTTGGDDNTAQIRVVAIRSGDFSFGARLEGASDAETARRFLEAAEALAPDDARGDVRGMARDLARHSRHADRVRRRLAGLLRVTMAGDFRTLLEAAQSAL